MKTETRPDVAGEKLSADFAALDWVGMKEIELPLLLEMSGEKLRLPARAEAKVSLDRQASRGIHMSRLYLLLQEKFARTSFRPELMAELTDAFLQSHRDLSSRAFVSLHFEWPLSRHALKSANQAWRTYPVTYSCENDGHEARIFLEVLVTYSSTCPASAALARQLIQENFKKTFSGTEVATEKIHQWLGSTEGIIATPHAQRSLARVKVRLTAELSAETLIDAIEEALQTPVQGAVKREDEQEFALRNGQNLMFCEDAARRVKKALDRLPAVADYLAELNHVESLHPHNAVSRVSKGLDLKDF